MEKVPESRGVKSGSLPNMDGKNPDGDGGFFKKTLIFQNQALDKQGAYH
jgi:hypothetical protein